MSRANDHLTTPCALKFSASVTFLCPDRPAAEYAPTLARAGFSAVEFQRTPNGGAAAHVTALRNEGLSVALLNIDVGDFIEAGAGLSGAPHRQDDFLLALKAAANDASTLGADIVNVGPARVLPGMNRRACLNQLRDNVRRSCETLAPLGIRVAIEALNTRDYANLLIDSPDAALELIDSVGHPNAVLQYDIYHAAVDGRNVESDLRRFAGRIAHVQFADAPGRHQPGTGTLPLDDYFTVLYEAGYLGYIGAEYIPTGRYDSSCAWLERYRRFNSPSSQNRSSK